MIPTRELIHVFIGYDSRQTALFNVAQHSIIRHCSKPVSIIPIKLSHLRGIFEREKLAIQSTEFSFSRFLTPYLCGFEGWALFMDCDVIARGDLAELWALRDERYAVQCVKHDHQPSSSMKFLGEQQTQYEKKNWSSVMLMNCAKCTTLTPDYVNTASGLELHQFKWLESEELIGEIPRAWNFLVDYYAHDEAAKLLHYTSGGPYYADYRNVDFAEEWFENYRDANQTADSDYLALTEAARQSRDEG
jgi:lipopolysaccharide biosynthesis glycosyltransferase